MRLLLLLLMLAGITILLIQNQQPVLIYFLGTDSQTALYSLKLPLGLWVVIFTAAGIFTSFLMQILKRSPRQTGTFQPPKRSPRSPTPPERPYQRPETQRSDWEIPPNPEWEDTSSEDNDEEWNIEEPPTETTLRDQSQQTPVDKPVTDSNFEVQKPPKTTSRDGTVYSYTYRELSDRQKSPTEPEPDIPQSFPQTHETHSSEKSTSSNQVYDAKYRIILPPYQTPTDDSIDDEDDESWV